MFVQVPLVLAIAGFETLASNNRIISADWVETTDETKRLRESLGRRTMLCSSRRKAGTD